MMDEGDEHRLDPAYALSISCAPNPAYPRSFDPGLWSAGSPADWYESVLEPRILASTAGMVFVRNPGGMEPTGDNLLFDQLTNCQNQSGTMPDANIASKLRIMGEHTEWAWVCGEIRKTRRVALYLGAVSHWDSFSTQKIVYLAHKELDPFIGMVDEIYVDGAAESVEHGAYPVVHRVCQDLGMVCGAECRALVGRYSQLHNHPHCCIGTKWDSSGGVAGDRYHAPFVAGQTCWIFSDDADPGKVNAQRYARETGKVAVGIWDENT